MVTTSTQGGESANQPKTLSERQRWELLRLAEKAVQDTQDYLTPTAPDSSPASNASRPARLRSPWSLLAGNCRPKTIRSVTRWTKGGMLQNQNLSESIRIYQNLSVNRKTGIWEHLGPLLWSDHGQLRRLVLRTMRRHCFQLLCQNVMKGFVTLCWCQGAMFSFT